MAATDDLPWPELGNVSRGATRGNQGQKGCLGPSDREGRSILQLRVQPGVLAVRLNRQASEWYKILDAEVNRALKLTKTYWRKARRRQDYDARADQDHMELHEWLQQLKDKTMSHLELLMQKGDIQGPPYAMSDDIELTFLRKFIERQAAGIPHNPRLRNGALGNPQGIRGHSVESMTPEPSDHGYVNGSDSLDHRRRHAIIENGSEEDSSVNLINSSRTSVSPSSRNLDSLTQEASSSRQVLQSARGTLSRAQKETQDAFLKYTACLDTERQARQAVYAAERRRDDIMSALLSRNQPIPEAHSRHSSVSADEHRSPLGYHAELDERMINRIDQYPEAIPIQDHRTASDGMRSSRPTSRSMDWPEVESQTVYGVEAVAHFEDAVKTNRKHSRIWDRNGQLQDGQYACEDMTTLPPRKRVHHMMTGFDVLNNVALQTQNMAMQS